MCPGACHYWGRIHWREAQDSKHYNLEHMLREPCFQCEEIGSDKTCYLCEGAGSWEHKTERYVSRADLIKAAKVWFRKTARRQDVLCVGQWAACEPKEILSGPKKIKEAGNKIHKRVLSYGEDRWVNNEKTMLRLWKEWETILGNE